MCESLADLGLRNWFLLSIINKFKIHLILFWLVTRQKKALCVRLNIICEWFWRNVSWERLEKRHHSCQTEKYRCWLQTRITLFCNPNQHFVIITSTTLNTSINSPSWSLYFLLWGTKTITYACYFWFILSFSFICNVMPSLSFFALSWLTLNWNFYELDFLRSGRQVILFGQARQE